MRRPIAEPLALEEKGLEKNAKNYYYISEMGIFLTYSNKEKIKEEIYKYLEAKKLRKISESEDAFSKNTIKAEGQISKKHAQIAWEIEPYGNSNSVKMDVRPSRSLQIRVFIRSLFFLTMLWIFPLMFKKLWKGAYSLPIILIVLFVIFVLSGLLYLKDRLMNDIFAKLEANFRIFAKENIDIKIESPPNVHLLPLWLDLIISICLCLIIFYFLSATLPILFYLLLPIQGMLLANIFLVRLARKENHIVWKYMLIGNVARWTAVILAMLAFFFMLYMFNSKFFIDYENEMMGKTVSLKETFSISYFEKSMMSFKQQLGDPVKYKIKMIEDLIENGVKRLYEKPGDQERKNMSRYLFSLVVNFGIFVLVLSIMPYLFSFIFLLNVSKIWQLLVAEGSPTSIRPPPVLIKSKRLNILFYPILIMWTLFSFIYNIAFAIISIDVISYVILNKSLIIKESAAIFSWVPTIFILFSRLHHPNQEALNLFFSKMFLLSFAFPFLYLIFRWGLNILSRIGKKINEIFNQGKMEKALSIKVKEAISEISEIHNLKAPKIFIKDLKGAPIGSSSGIFSRRATITMNKELIRVLNDKEIIAVFAHEIAHAKYDLRKEKILRIISRLTLFPNFFLTIFLNYRKIEERADKFAVEATKSSEDLRSALLTMSTLSLFSGKDFDERKNVKQKGLNILKKIYFLDDFFFGESLIGYSHPEIHERLAEIKKAY